MTTADQDIDTILAEPKEVTLLSGNIYLIQRLKTRQLMKMLRILTKGLGDAITEYRFDPDNGEEFMQTIFALAAIAIPEAEDETIEFLQSMLLPKGYVENPKTKADEGKNETLYAQFATELFNPEVEDLIDLVEAIFEAEKEHILSLGKRLATLLKAQQKATTAKRGAKGKASPKA